MRSKGYSVYGMWERSCVEFSDVRVHVSCEAERLGATAFTIGSAIYFAPGFYQPETTGGVRLLAHELAHVAQQRAGRTPNSHGVDVAILENAQEWKRS